MQYAARFQVRQLIEADSYPIQRLIRKTELFPVFLQMIIDSVLGFDLPRCHPQP